LTIDEDIHSYKVLPDGTVAWSDEYFTSELEAIEDILYQNENGEDELFIVGYFNGKNFSISDTILTSDPSEQTSFYGLLNEQCPDIQLSVDSTSSSSEYTAIVDNPNSETLSINWYDLDNNMQISIDSTVMDLEPGNYSCVVQNSIGCGARVDFIVPNLNVFAHSLTQSSIKIYPNPAVDVINIVVDGSLTYRTTLFDLQGKPIISSNNSESIRLHNITAGIYLLEIQDITTGQKIVEKIIVNN